jgi:histidinol-phosphate aminotransferase
VRELIRKEIHTLTEYTLRQYSSRIKLNQNENPYDLPQQIKDEILQRVGALSWSRYPPFVPQRQIEKLAAFTGWREDGILIGNGSNDLLQLLFTSTLERGVAAVISQPTFTLYKILAQGMAADIHEVPMTASFQFDVERIIAAANDSDARLIVICSPNNPTGTSLSRDEVRTIIERTTALVVLDEAYVHFARESHASLLKEYDRLVVLQTFSKAMGAAGLRIGYAMLSARLAKELSKLKLPYSVNIFSLIAMETLVERWDTIKGWIELLKHEREFVLKELARIPTLTPYRSEANFLLFESGEKTPAQIFDALLGKGILIRDVSSYPMLGRGLRVTVGKPEENQEFLSVLKEAV